VIGLTVADRAYFAEALAELRTASPALDRARARPSGAGGLVLVIAEPVLDASGRFDGIVYGALDRQAFLPLLDQGREGPAELMTLLDEGRRVLVSQDPRLTPGMALAPLVPPNALGGAGARNFEWMPPRDSSFRSRLGLDLRHGAYQPVVMTRLAVLGDLPASELHAAMAPAVGQILGFLVLTAAALLLTVAFLVRRLAQPLLAANDVATDIADGRLGGGADLDALRSSPVHEVRTLARHLDTMRRALAERQAVSVAREHELEQQLLHAQKMEAIGRLAGGVAHDFNNLLTPILSYSDLVLADLPGDHPVRDDVAQIRASAERARGLTRQLLTFGRKQMLEMRVVDLAGEVRDFERLLRPLVRENVELRVQTAAGGGCVRADVAQVEQMLMNLVVNAVDAMPNGGLLSVAVERSTMAGGRPALALIVRDTGHGMDATTRAHAFEPFFTTKERGKGTGLGLATVYGIVKQHGGEITLDSAPGAGTTFRVAFPLIAGAAELPAPHAGAAPVRGGAETIMVVEDEPAVRSLVCTILRRHGYDVIDAEGPDDAVRRSADASCRIDLLLTDVMMPRMNGRELYERIHPLRPGLRVLYMSGYTGDVIASQGVLEGATHVLHKPFTVDGLTAKVRRVLSAIGTAA
jgi:signal transduction histidine kinase/ActR/RegA family two-component response regulator